VVAFVLCLAINSLFGRDIGKISRENEVKITPAGWAFSIWGLIYSLLTGFVVLQAILKTEKTGPVVKAIGPWFIIGNFFNALWLITWTQNTVFWISIAAVVLLSILASNLVILHLAKSFKQDNGHSMFEFIFIDVAFSIYASWTTVASILNVSISLMANKWGGFGINQSSWGAVMVIIAAAINIAMLYRENNQIYPLVFVWASLAIYSKN